MSLLVDACLGHSIPRTPIWIMRQAGRYLPEYQAIRGKHDFLTMLHTPELAAKITLQPIRRFDFDAAIIFSDILVIPEAMGHPFQLKDGLGPCFEEAVDSRESIEKLLVADITQLNYVFESISLVRNELDKDKALIGFSGAPWTIATYLVEGGPHKDHRRIRGLMYSDPVSLSLLMEKLTRGIIEYVKEQIRAGVDVIQIFDTNAGLLTRKTFERFSLPYLKRIVAAVKEEKVPVILFVKGGNSWLDLIKSTNGDVIGIDWAIPLSEVRSIVGENVSLQGNLDPTVLYAKRNTIRNEVIELLKSYGTGHRHIFNLGHGIFPDIPLDAVQVLIDTVKKESPKFHFLDKDGIFS